MTRIAIPLEQDKGLESEVSEHFGDAPYLLVCNVERKKVRNWKVLSNPGVEATQRKGMEAGKLLVDESTDAVAVVQLGEGAYWMLNANKIKVLQITDESGRRGAEWYARNWRTLNEVRR